MFPTNKVLILYYHTLYSKRLKKKKWFHPFYQNMILHLYLNYKNKIKIGFHKILIAKRLVISIVEVQLIIDYNKYLQLEF